MQQRNLSTIEIILSAIALVLLISIFFKAILDVDTNYDVGWYHLPFAARIWGIIPAESFISENKIEYRFEGFPLLANFFQGMLWKLTGRVQATNLVGYFSLVIYFFFLRTYFQVPLYLSIIAIFTIPAVLTHAATSFVDLPGNIGASVVVMMTYSFFQQSKLPNKKELLIIFLGAAVAVNTKPQLQPLIFLLYWVVVTRLVWLYFKYTDSSKRKLWLTIGLGAIASALIFATPIKNVVLYGNPFYPTKVEIAGIVLNHQATPQAYQEGSRPQKWLRSILEINTPEWTVDQYNYSGNEKNLDRAGGFFGAYVILNLLLLTVLALKERFQNQKSVEKARNAIVAILIMLITSLFIANFPQSHELRYFMFWMITLVSINLSIVSSFMGQKTRWLNPKYLGVYCLPLLAIVLIKVDNSYLRPTFETPEKYMVNAVNWELLNQVVPNQRVCMISRHAIPNLKAVPYASIANAVFYSSYFHPEIKYDYSIKAAISPEICDDLPVIPQNLEKFINN